MKIIALNNVEIAGRGIVKRGDIIDFPKERIDTRIAANFLSAADDSRLKVAVKEDNGMQGELLPKTKGELLAEQDREREEMRKALIEKLGAEGIREQLGELRVSIPPNADEKKLADMLLDRFGE